MENLQSSNPKPTGQVLENVGYGTIVKDPKRIVESQGFKLALNELGLTEELVTTALVDDINNKEKNRLGELKLGAELLQMTKKEEEGVNKTTNVYNFFHNDTIQAEVKDFEDKIKEELQK